MKYKPEDFIIVEEKYEYNSFYIVYVKDVLFSTRLIDNIYYKSMSGWCSSEYFNSLDAAKEKIKNFLNFCNKKKEKPKYIIHKFEE